MTVSIIIVAKDYCENLRECVDRCLGLDFTDFEIIVMPDRPLDDKRYRSIFGPVPDDQRIRIIPTGSISPPQKRDKAIEYANGDILAFIDDDAYPAKDWLKKALENFEDQNVAAVGGPGITPPKDSLNQQASGLVYSFSLINYRYLPKMRQEVDDFPTCNLFVRKSIMRQLGGFDTNFWPGEDTKLCLDITKKLGKKIIYDPGVLVYHHRRPLFLPHLKQVASYALHRGYFVKRYPQTSMRISYFIPSIFLVALITGAILALFFNFLKLMYFLSLYLYIVLIFIYSISKGLHFFPYVFFGCIFTHVTYGVYFIKGILSKRLREEEL